MSGGDNRDCDGVLIVVVVSDEKECTAVLYSGLADTNTRAATRRTIGCDSLFVVVDVHRCRPGVSSWGKRMVFLVRLLRLSLFSNEQID